YQCGESHDAKRIRISICPVLHRHDSGRRMESWTSLQTRYLGGANRPRLQSLLSLLSVYSVGADIGVPFLANDGGATYDNRFISVVTIEHRKIVQWRDYM